MIMSQASDHSARGAGTPRLLLTVREAAEALAISRSKLYQLFAAGLVDSIRVDGSRRVPLAALESYIDERRKAEKAEAAA
jgi:excisionase family DNA binding protein